MSFRGRGRGRGRGWRGGGRTFQDYGPPETVVELGSFMHPCEGDLVCKGTNNKIPYFNAPLYLENKAQIGKVDEIFGPMHEYHFSVKLLSDMKATSFNVDQKFYIDPMKLLPLARFLPRAKTPGRGGVRKRGGGRGGTPRGRGFTPRGGFRGGFAPRGGFRGGQRGGFTPRGGRGRGRGFRGRGSY